MLTNNAIPSAMVIADTESGRRAATVAVQAAGYRLVADVSMKDAASRLDEQIALDAVMIECGASAPMVVHPLVDAMPELASRRHLMTIICTNIEGIDAYSARLGDENVSLLCTPDIADRVVALQLAAARKGHVLNDSATELESMRLRRLADEVGRIAKALSSLSTPAEPDPGLIGTPVVRDVPMSFRGAGERLDTRVDGPTAAELRATIRARRTRDQFFASDLFADPAWDMLLDLLAARLERVQVAVSSLCIASAVPPTTALRWIKRMTDDGLLERVADPDDGRRIFIRLSDQAAESLARYWATARRLGGAII